MLTRQAASARARRLAAAGFTLIELMVTLALLALVLRLAAPSFSQWTRNAQVRTTSDALQDGLRNAQAEATRRSRQVVFFLTNTAACTTAANATASGRFWQIRTAPLLAGEATEALQCGVLPEPVNAVAITGPTALCFNSVGRQVANAAPGVGAGFSCTLPAGGTHQYDVSATGSDRPLRVLVSLGGQVRQCDPARALAAASPDGCP